MSNIFCLTDAQMTRLQPFFPKSHGKPRVDDRRVLSGITFIHRNGLRWRDAPREYGPPKSLYYRWKRWSEKGIFARMIVGLAAEAAVPKTVTIDETYLKAHRTATRLLLKKGDWRPRAPHDRPHKRRHEHQTARGTDADGRPIRCFVVVGRVSDYAGAAALLSNLPSADWLLADQGNDADLFR